MCSLLLFFVFISVIFAYTAPIGSIIAGDIKRVSYITFRISNETAQNLQAKLNKANIVERMAPQFPVLAMSESLMQASIRFEMVWLFNQQLPHGMTINGNIEYINVLHHFQYFICDMRCIRHFDE